jgi:hypothetical protein
MITIFHRGHLLFLIVAGCLLVAPPTRASDASDLQQKLNGGYYLLYNLAGDENQLPILLDLKHAPPNVGELADRISKEGKKTLGLIEKFQDQNPALRDDRNPLPAIEQDVRDSIKGDKQHQLLFGTKDAEFVRALCISQIEASTYAAHLAKVLGDQESSPSRAAQLRHVSDEWLALRANAEQILRDY